MILSLQTAVVYARTAGDQTSNAEAQYYLGTVMLIDGRYTEGIYLLTQSLPVLRENGRHQLVMVNLRSLGLGYVFIGEYVSARTFLQEAFEKSRGLGAWREAAMALFGLGCARLAEGDLEFALITIKESVDKLRELGNISELGWMLGGLALAHLALGDEIGTHDCVQEGLELAIRSESFITLSTCLPAAACLMAVQDQAVEALKVYETAASLGVVRNSRWHAQVCGPMIAVAVEQLAPEVAAGARQSGQNADLGETVRWLLDHFPESHSGVRSIG